MTSKHEIIIEGFVDDPFKFGSFDAPTDEELLIIIKNGRHEYTFRADEIKRFEIRETYDYQLEQEEAAND